MFDLKKALRDGSMIGWSAEEYFDIIMKASIEIERLEVEVVRLRAEIVKMRVEHAKLRDENKRLQRIIFNLTGADG